MTKRKIIWLICLLSTFVTFYFLIPNSIYNISPLLISVIGAILFTFFAVQSLADFRSFKELNNSNKEEQDWRHKYTPILVLPGLAMIFVFVMHYSSKENDELKENGILVTGVVVDGTSIKNRKGGIYTLTINFKTKEGQLISVTESVNENDFKAVSKGQNIELMYSKKDPKIIKLLIDINNLKSYHFKGKVEKDIAVNDLINFINISNDSLGSILNQMNYKWEFNATDSIWNNNIRDIYIKSNYKNKILLISFDLTEKTTLEKESFALKKYSNQFTLLNFKEFKIDSNIIYKKGNYIGNIENITKKSGIGFQVGQKIQVEKQ